MIDVAVFFLLYEVFYFLLEQELKINDIQI